MATTTTIATTTPDPVTTCHSDCNSDCSSESDFLSQFQCQLNCYASCIPTTIPPTTLHPTAVCQRKGLLLQNLPRLYFRATQLDFCIDHLKLTLNTVPVTPIVILLLTRH